MDTSQVKENSSAQNKENIANGVPKGDSRAMEVESETSKPNLPDQNLDNNKTDNKPEFEIVNENYKNPGGKVLEYPEANRHQEEDQINIKVSDKDKDKDHKDKDKKKKKKKNKKKDKKDEAGQEDGGPTKKVKTSVLDNKNIPEELRQKYYEIEKNPLAVAIANIPIGVNKSELLTYFTTLLTSLQDVGNLVFMLIYYFEANPIRNIEVGATGNFAIMELDTKDIRDFCLTLENLEFKAYKLSILRVKGFFNKVYDAEASGIDPFGNISTVASSEDNKLYVGSIPLFLKEEDVRKICEAFGFLRYFNLVKDNEGNHKGYCFIEYMDTKSAEKALKGLNELDIGDRKLKVQKAVAVAAPKVVVPVHGAKPTNSSGSFLLGFPGIGDLNVQSMLNVPGSCKTPSRVIQILNMCTIEDLLEDDFYKDLMEDVREEAAKFGPIDTIVIPRPDQKTGIVGPSVGKIFVKFQYLIPAKQARHRLSGRSYNKRTIVTSFYPEEKFDTEEYLQNPL